MNSVSPLEPREIFQDWVTLRIKIEKWQIRDDFAFTVRVKDNNRVDYICRINGCDWRVFASRNQQSEIQLKILHERHSCIG